MLFLSRKFTMKKTGSQLLKNHQGYLHGLLFQDTNQVLFMLLFDNRKLI